MQDSMTAAYNAACREGGRGALNLTRGIAERLPWVEEHRLLPRPFFVPRDEMLGCVADLTDLFDIMTQLPDRLFGGDRDEYCKALRLEPAKVAMFQRFGGPPDLYGRADLYHDGQSFKLLEFNVHSALGGVITSEVSVDHLRSERFAEFSREHELTHVNTGEKLAQCLLSAASTIVTGGSATIALIEGNGEIEKYLHEYRSLQDCLRKFGVDLILGTLEEIENRNGNLFLRGQRVHVVLRYFSDPDIFCDSRSLRAVEDIIRSHELGNVVLWTTPQSGLVHNKLCLAMLSGNAGDPAFSHDETLLINRMIPWTRILDSNSIEVHEACMEDQENLIVKPGSSHGGQGCVAGWEVSRDEWRQVLSAGAAAGHVVQRRVIPRPEEIIDPVSGAATSWDAVWSPFLMPHGYGGAFVRAVPTGVNGVINMGSSGGTRTAGVFEYPVNS